jgi:hypothetical protein
VNTTPHLPPQYDQLTSERHVLCLKSALRLEWRDQEGQEEAEQRNHRAADVRRFSYLIKTDEVFGTHSCRVIGTAGGKDKCDWTPSKQHDREQAIPIRELDATAHPPLQHNQLMSERRVLCRKSVL